MNLEGDGEWVAYPPIISMLGYNLMKHWHMGIKLSTCNLQNVFNPFQNCVWIVDEGKHGQVHNSLACIGLSESDSKLYPNFEFCEGKNHKLLKNTLIYKIKKFMLTKKKKKKKREFTYSRR